MSYDKDNLQLITFKYLFFLFLKPKDNRRIKLKNPIY